MGARRYPPLEARLWKRVSKDTGCWEFHGARNAQGYGLIRGRIGGRRVYRAHRIAYELTYGPIPDGLDVLHQCDNPPCVRPDHLFLGTDADNAADRDSKGRWRGARGEAQGAARLTEADVLRSRERYREGALCRVIAADLGVSMSTVHRAVTGRTWAHLPLFDMVESARLDAEEAKANA